MARVELTATRLRQLMSYDRSTGKFTRLCDIPSGHRKGGTVSARSGEEPGYINDGGYRIIAIDTVDYRAHRLAILYETGKSLPSDVEIDHINGDPADNRWVNLRVASRIENSQNARRPRANNSTGFLGVTYHKRARKFMARIVHAGKEKYLGCYATPELAHEAYVQAKRSLHPFCTI